MTFPSEFGFYLRPGDILYSGKHKYTWGVGHVGIVGTDGLVRHVIPYGKQMHSIDDFFRNFVHVSVLRYKCEKVSYEAAEMSELLFNEIERYSLHPSLRKVSRNHCTKYVWQSFFYSQSRDVLWQLTDGMKLVIVPSLFIYGSKGVFQKVLTFSY